MDPFRKISQWRTGIFELETNQYIDAATLMRRVDVRALELWRLGVRERSRVTLMKAASVDFFVDLGAIWRLHAVALVLDGSLKPKELGHIFNEARPHIVLNSEGDQLLKAPAGPEFQLPDSSCLILYTSGSTAVPKAVVHTAESLHHRIDAINQAIDPTLRDISFNVLPVHFGHGLIGVCLSALCLEARLAISPRISIHNAHMAGHWLDVSQATFMSGTPAIWKMIVSMNSERKPTLKRVQCASAMAGAQLFHKIETWAKAPLWNVYGLTECASWVSDHRFVAKGDEPCIGDGRAWGTKFSIDRSDHTNTGLLRLRSQGLFSQYWGLSRTESGVCDDWFSTEDIATQSNDGRIRLVGRTSRLINRGGTKVSPEEVESAILEHPSVDDVFVFGKSRDSSGEQETFVTIAALVVCSQPLLSENLREFLSDRISDYKVPTAWRFVHAIPKTSNGKIDQREARALWLRTGDH